MSPTKTIAPEDVIERVAELPPLSASVSQVILACDDPDMTVGQLTQIILQDQNLTANILKVANSAFYGHARRVATATEAVVLLGFSAMKSLAISSHTARLLKTSLPGYGLEDGELWAHSLGVAFIARRIAIEARLAPVEEVFVAGLLHDLGKLILSSYLQPVFVDIVRIADERKEPFHHVEAEVLGFGHAELGGQIAASWNFPPELEEAVRYHHDPAQATRKPMVAHAVHLADAVCMMLGVGLGADGMAYTARPETLDALGYDQDRLMSLMSEMEPLITDTAMRGTLG